MMINSQGFELISRRELSRRLKIGVQWISTYFCRTEFRPYFQRNRIIYCDELIELVKALYNERGKRRKPYNALNKERETSFAPILLQ